MRWCGRRRGGRRSCRALIREACRGCLLGPGCYRDEEHSPRTQHTHHPAAHARYLAQCQPSDPRSAGQVTARVSRQNEAQRLGKAGSRQRHSVLFGRAVVRVLLAPRVLLTPRVRIGVGFFVDWRAVFSRVLDRLACCSPRLLSGDLSPNEVCPFGGIFGVPRAVRDGSPGIRTIRHSIRFTCSHRLHRTTLERGPARRRPWPNRASCCPEAIRRGIGALAASRSQRGAHARADVE